MKRSFTNNWHVLTICLLLSLASTAGFSKTFNPFKGGPGKSYSTFKAELLNNNISVGLQWTMPIELTEGHFEVERSFDHEEFKTVAIVFSPDAEFSNSNSYNYRDNSKALIGKSQAWYRIKEVDGEGRTTFSPERLVSFDQKKAQISLYPNPFVEKLNVKFLNQSGKAEVRILNCNGDLISQRSTEIDKSMNNIEMHDLSGASNGIYIVEILMNGIIIQRQKIVKN